jgi:3-oxoacyl-[acyl-carrier protein] reductase
MEYGLKGKNAFVGGASRGIGRATAIALATAGASVTVSARSEQALIDLCAALPRDAGQEHRHLVLDYDDTAALGREVASVAATGPIHILINNSGGPPGGPVHAAGIEEFETAFRRHVLANQVLVQALLPGMREAGYGRLINVISTSVKEPIPGLGVSNTIRGAVASWAKTLAGELGPWGITVNNVLPGFTRTERLQSLFEGRAAKQGRDFEDVEKAALAQVPAGRFAKPEETAAAIAFLASPAAGYINGINLPVDGGRTKSL